MSHIDHTSHFAKKISSTVEVIPMAKLLLGLLLALAILGTTSAAGCVQDAEDMKRECKQFELFPANPKLPPSAACCAVWKRADVPCLCKYVNKEVEKVWCMEKVVYVANYCKRPFQPGYKCGSKWTHHIYVYTQLCPCFMHIVVWCRWLQSWLILFSWFLQVIQFLLVCKRSGWDMWYSLLEL